LPKPTVKKRGLKKGRWLWFDFLYRVNIGFIVCEPENYFLEAGKILPREAVAHLRQFMNNAPPSGSGSCTNLHEEDYGQVVLIWVRPEVNIGVLAHEALHAASFVLRRKGLRFSSKSEEAFTYYMEWIFEEALKRAS
jgi:hypothetical protein